MMKLEDIEVIEIIQENPYLQHILDLKYFTKKPDDKPTPAVGAKNKARLKLDATVPDAQIGCPANLELLSDSRVKAED